MNVTEQFNWNSNEDTDTFGTFGYFVNNQGYTIYANVDITENSSEKLKGTWSGTGYDMNGDEAYDFTEGSFEIYHE